MEGPHSERTAHCAHAAARAGSDVLHAVLTTATSSSTTPADARQVPEVGQANALRRRVLICREGEAFVYLSHELSFRRPEILVHRGAQFIVA